jgi:ribosome-associated toxin RatA of RatAB toxin-antitoxin module
MSSFPARRISDVLPLPLRLSLADDQDVILPDTAENDSRRMTATLPRPAKDCYELFCDVTRVPAWLSVVRSATVVRRDAEERPLEVAFLARLEGATVGYTCRYVYTPGRYRVGFSTSARSRIRVAGFAEFEPLGDAACLVSFALELNLGIAGALPSWGDPLLENHASSTSLGDFRDYVLRAL